MAHGPGLSAGVIEIRCRHGVFGQVLFIRQQGMQPWADLETAFGQHDSGLEQGGPGHLAVRAVGHFQHAQGAGHTDRTASHHAVMEGHGFAVGIEEKFFVSAGGRSLAAVVGFDGLAVGVQQECPTANAAGLGLHQGEHHLHGDGRIDGRAPGLEYLVTGIGRQRVGGCHSKLGCGPAGLFGIARSAFGLCGHGVVQCGGAGAACKPGGCGQQADTGRGDAVGHGNLQGSRRSNHGKRPCTVVPGRP